MALTHRQTDRQTDRHCDSMTESAKWAELVKIHTTERRKNQFNTIITLIRQFLCSVVEEVPMKISIYQVPLKYNKGSAFENINISL